MSTTTLAAYKSYEGLLTEMALRLEAIMQSKGLTRSDLYEKVEIEPDVIDAIVDADPDGAAITMRDLAHVEAFLESDLLRVKLTPNPHQRRRPKPVST